MNILFIHEVDWLRKVVFDIHFLSEVLSLKDHKVYAVDYESMWERHGSLISRYKEIDNVSRALPNSSICLIRPPFIKIAGLSRISAFYSHYWTIRKAIKEKEIDVVMLYSVPTNGLQAISASKKFGIPIVFRSLDVLNQLVVQSILRVPTKLLEKRVYPKMDMILTLTPTLSEYVIGLGAKEDKVKVLPIVADTNIFKPIEDVEDVRKLWGFAKDDLIVMFMGTLFEFSGLDDFIPKFKYIIKEFPKAKLLIVGDGIQRPLLEGIIKTTGLENKVVITGFQPYQMMPYYINLAAVCVNTFIPNDTTKDVFPGKTVQFLACGKPLVNSPLPGMKAMISGENQGVVYADDTEDIVKKILLLLKSPTRRQKIGENGLCYARQVHSYEKVSCQLETILEQAIKGEHSK